MFIWWSSKCICHMCAFNRLDTCVTCIHVIKTLSSSYFFCCIPTCKIFATFTTITKQKTILLIYQNFPFCFMHFFCFVNCSWILSFMLICKILIINARFRYYHSYHMNMCYERDVIAFWNVFWKGFIEEPSTDRPDFSSNFHLVFFLIWTDFLGTV